MPQVFLTHAIGQAHVPALMKLTHIYSRFYN